jgi:hypothetical protein
VQSARRRRASSSALTLNAAVTPASCHSGCS